jgi:hypothetical protein
LQPLLYVLLCMTWCLGDSQPERFETARAFCVACRPERRRPGKTFLGWQKALDALPACVLRRLASRLGPFLHTDGWAVLGCDGSRLRCPRVGQLERRLGDPGGDSSSGRKAPQLWLTALAHLQSGVPWSWMAGKGDASERDHLARLIGTLSGAALVVCDAGYQGYPLARALADAGRSFLMRVSTQTIFYAADDAASLETREVESKARAAKEVTARQMEKWSDGVVYYWPEQAQKRRQEAIAVRLLCVRGKTGGKDVWLASNVLDGDKLSLQTAGRFYKMRWENEGGVFQDLQADAGEGETGGQDGQGGAPRGVGCDVGGAGAAGARGPGGGPVRPEEGGQQRPAAGAVGPPGDRRGAARQEQARLPGQGGGLPARAAAAHQRQAEAGLALSPSPKAPQPPKNPPARRGR